MIWSPKSITPSSRFSCWKTPRLGQLEPLQRGVVRAVGAVLLQLLEPLLVERDDLVGRAPVVRGLLGELEDLVDQRGLPLGRDVLERHLVQHARAELGALGSGQHPLARLDAGKQAVPVQDLRGEPVVVEDLGSSPSSRSSGGERAAHPQLEVLGRLVRERQAQDVAGQHAG